MFNIRLIWFWNHGMVHACLYISCLCIYCFLNYALFIFLISILIAIYSWLYYIVKKILRSKWFFFCVLKPQVYFKNLPRSISRNLVVYDYMWLTNEFWKFSEMQIFLFCFWQYEHEIIPCLTIQRNTLST